MQEIAITTPEGQGKSIARIALEQGITEASVSQVYTYGPDKQQDEVTVLCSAPQAAALVKAIMSAQFYTPKEYGICVDEVLAIVTSDPPKKITQPMKISPTTILQDLWIQNHVTAAYLARASISALLLGYSLLAGDLTTLIIALLFAPFLTQDLAIGFGAWMRDWRLARQGALVMGLSTIIAVIAGAIVAAVMGGPLKYDQFGTIQSNFAISFLVGIVAGLDTADEAGRREFIAVAGAAQFASFPVWFGISLILGFPDSATTWWRIATFLVNIVTILVVSLGVYILLRYRPENIERYLRVSQE